MEGKWTRHARVDAVQHLAHVVIDSNPQGDHSKEENEVEHYTAGAVAGVACAEELQSHQEIRPNPLKFPERTELEFSKACGSVPTIVPSYGRPRTVSRRLLCTCIHRPSFLRNLQISP